MVGARADDFIDICPDWEMQRNVFLWRVEAVQVCEFVPVRPRDDDYDEVYYAANLAAYLALNPKADHFSLLTLRPPFAGTYQQWREDPTCAKPKSYAIMAVDVGYYFGDYLWQDKDCTLFAVGGTFPTFPGVYDLPAREGQYRVFGEGGFLQIEMRTQATSLCYRHPHVRPDGPEVLIRYGFYAHYLLIKPAIGVLFRKLKAPPVSCSKSPIANVLVSYYKTLTPMEVTRIAIQQLEPLQVTNADIHKMRLQSLHLGPEIYLDWLTTLRSGRGEAEVFSFPRWTSPNAPTSVFQKTMAAVGLRRHGDVPDDVLTMLHIGGRNASLDAQAGTTLRQLERGTMEKKLFVEDLASEKKSAPTAEPQFEMRYFLNQRLKEFSEINPEICPDVEDERRVRQCVEQWMSRNPAPSMLGNKGKSKPAKHMAKVTPTGYDVLKHDVTGTNEYVGYEWTTSDWNSLYGVYGRYFSNTMRPDPVVVRDFSSFMNRIEPMFQKAIDLQSMPEF